MGILLPATKISVLQLYLRIVFLHILDSLSGEERCWCTSTAKIKQRHISHVGPSECLVCGCSRHVDDYGDRILWCGPCKEVTLNEMQHQFYSNPHQSTHGVCGCSRHVDDYEDRICWCDSCKEVTMMEMQDRFHANLLQATRESSIG